MKNILIINLKRNGDILYMAHTINSIKHKYPDIKISALVFEEFKKCATLLRKVDRVFCINRKRIVSILKNKIYSDHFAINELYSVLSSIDKVKWDCVFNYSNDKISSHLTSFLTNETQRKSTGVKIRPSGLVFSSNQWSELFNEFIVEHQQVPSPFAYYYCRMISSVYAPPAGYDLSENDKYKKEVERRISLLKRNKRGKIKIIGISVCASHPEKSIKEQKAIDIISNIQKEKDLIPIVIHAPSPKERKIVQNIMVSVREKIVTIECDLIAAVSVIKYLDILITPDTALKHIADLVCTPSLEISLAEAPLFKQSSLLSDSLVLSAPIYERSFHRSRSDNTYSTHDIILACKHILFPKQSKNFSSNIVLYRPSQDFLGPYLKLIYGKSNIFDEITRVGLRVLIHKIFNHKRKISEYKNIFLRYNEQDIREWSRPQKEDIERDLESVHSIIRILEDNDEKKKKDFLLELDLLLEGSKYFSFSGLCLSIFRGRIENMTQKSPKDNLKEFNKDLQNLKNHLMETHSLIQSIEKSCVHNVHTRTQQGQL